MSGFLHIDGFVICTDMQDVLDIETDEDTEKLVRETIENYESKNLASAPSAFVEAALDRTGGAAIQEFGNLAELWVADVSDERDIQSEDSKVGS